MSESLSLFSSNAAPITWRRPGTGTYFFIQSKTPDNYTIRCVDEHGHFANPDLPTFHGDQKLAGPGHFYAATYYPHTGAEATKSPRYDSVEQAKSASDHHRNMGWFPDP